MQRELERQGYLAERRRAIELTAKAIRRIGQTALRRVFASLDGSTRGDARRATTPGRPAS